MFSSSVESLSAYVTVYYLKVGQDGNFQKEMINISKKENEQYQYIEDILNPSIVVFESHGLKFGGGSTHQDDINETLYTDNNEIQVNYINHINSSTY